MAANPKDHVIGTIFGRWRSQILHAGVRLGMFDALRRERRTADEVAQDLRTDPGATYRLLRALASIGLLSENDRGAFALTPAGQHLASDHPESLRGMALLEEGPEHYAIWKHLPDIVRTGGPSGFQREFGHGPFEHTLSDPRYAEAFDDAMTSYSAGETVMVLDALSGEDLSGVAEVCDVGGGHGHLLCSVLERNPHLRGKVLERPVVLEETRRLWAAKLGVSDRCEYVPGNMFEEVPPADLYFLKHILHDWNDEECLRILSNVHDAAPENGRLFIAEFVVPGPGTPHFAKLFDVHMLCATTGRERTESEYTTLLDESGWKFVRARYSTVGPMGVIEASIDS